MSSKKPSLEKVEVPLRIPNRLQGSPSPSTTSSSTSLSSKKHLIGLTRYKEDWYNMSRVIYPKQKLLDKIKQKQEIYLLRQSTEKALSKSTIHGSRLRVNRASYFQPIHSADPSYSEIADEVSDDEGEDNEANKSSSTTTKNKDKKKKQKNTNENNDEPDENNSNNNNATNESNLNKQQSSKRKITSKSAQTIESNSLGGEDETTQFPPTTTTSKSNQESNTNLSLQKAESIIVNISQQSQNKQQQLTQRSASILKLPSINTNNTTTTTQQQMLRQSKSEFKINESQSLDVVVQLPPISQGTTTPQQSNSKKLQSLIASMKAQQQLQGGGLLLNAMEMPSNGSVRFNQSPAERFRAFVINLSQTEQRILQKIESDASIRSKFEILLSIKPAAIASLLTKFYRLCVERIAVASSQKPFKYTPVDPAVLKNLSLSDSLAQSFAGIFANELKRSEFSSEKDAFTNIYRELCARYLLVDESLVSLGGARSLENMIRNVLEKVIRQYGISMTREEKDTASRYAVGLFQGNPVEQLDLLERLLPLNRIRVRAADIFLVKHFVFEELAKEEAVKWAEKVRVLGKIENLRFDYLRSVYSLPTSEEIVSNMRALSAAGSSFTSVLPYSNKESIAMFLSQFEANLIGSGDIAALMESMKQEGIALTNAGVISTVAGVAYTTTTNTNALLIQVEHILNSSLSRCKNASFSPVWMKKAIEYRFTDLKRRIELINNFEGVFEQIDEVIERFHAYNIILFKYMRIEECDRKSYANTAFFEQILIEVTATAMKGSSADVFSIDDAVQGIKFYAVQEKHWRFWIKSLKRILIEIKFPHSLVQSLADALVKIFVHGSALQH